MFSSTLAGVAAKHGLAPITAWGSAPQDALDFFDEVCHTLVLSTSSTSACLAVCDVPVQLSVPSLVHKLDFFDKVSIP